MLTITSDPILTGIYITWDSLLGLSHNNILVDIGILLYNYGNIWLDAPFTGTEAEIRRGRGPWREKETPETLQNYPD